MNLKDFTTAIIKLPEEMQQLAFLDTKISIFNEQLVLINRDFPAMIFKETGWEKLTTKDYK